MKCRQVKTVPMFLPILSPSGKPTQMESLRFVEIPCNLKDGHEGLCEPRPPRKKPAPR